MTISTLTVDWLVGLKKRGLFKERPCILELGPQEMVLPYAHFLYAVGGKHEHFLDGGDWKADGSKRMYEKLGMEFYSSSDVHHSRADYYMDLSEPLMIDCPLFDVIMDCGTLEHVFNIGQAFANVHDLTIDDGLMLHILPALGDINHGFWNIHPTVYYDIANANGYEILDWHYVDNFEARIAGRNHPDNVKNRFDFDALPVKINYDNVHSRFHLTNPHFDQEAMAQPLHTAAYCMVAFRKVPSLGARPFMFPTQSMYR